MAWETRGGRGRYYTRSVRAGGRVTRQYLGHGPLAEAIAAADVLTRGVLHEERREGRRVREEAAELDALVGGFCREVDAITGEALTAAGYHRPQRGKWRRRRGKDAGTDEGG